MFNFRKKNHIEPKYPSSCDIVLFGRKYSVEVIVEAEKNSDISVDIVKAHLSMLTNNTSQIESSVEEYVAENYNWLMENYYSELLIPSDIIQTELSSEKNSVNKHTRYVNLITRNLRPIYFSVVNQEQCYLFLYVNEYDEYGIDIDLLPIIFIHMHE